MIGLGVALVAGLITWALDRRRRMYADLATTPCAAVFAGLNEVKGRAWAAEPLSSHRTQTPSVWWDYTLEEERKHTHTSTDSEGRTTTTTTTQWHTIEAREERVPELEVVDDTGSAIVRLGRAKVIPRQVHRDTFREQDNRGFFEKLLTSGNRTGRYRETERAVAIGDDLFVVGECVLDQQRLVPILAERVMVSTRSEESHLGWLGFGVGAMALVTATALTIGVAMLVSPDEPATPVAVLPGLALTLVLLAVAWLITTYNRLRLVAQGADRAWSLIDVQLRRRHDLIPNLVRCVQAHGAYEQEALIATTAARTSTDLSDEAEAQTRALRTLLAVAEATPELTADQSFRRLQRELADTEGRIAGSRTFFNDSITLLRNRQHQFPASLVASRVPIAHRDLIDARGFERTVPAIEHAFTT
jgi:hypothetical protein